MPSDSMWTLLQCYSRYLILWRDQVSDTRGEPEKTAHLKRETDSPKQLMLFYWLNIFLIPKTSQKSFKPFESSCFLNKATCALVKQYKDLYVHHSLFSRSGRPSVSVWIKRTLNWNSLTHNWWCVNRTHHPAFGWHVVLVLWRIHTDIIRWCLMNDLFDRLSVLWRSSRLQKQLLGRRHPSSRTIRFTSDTQFHHAVPDTHSECLLVFNMYTCTQDGLSVCVSLSDDWVWLNCNAV